jgi:Carboxypeptidase regulatory-like domain
MQSITTNHKIGFPYILCNLCLLGLLFTVLSANRVFAQMDQGAITGTVVDPSGAVIRAADVTLTNTGTGLVLTSKTNKSGDYYFSPIKTGTYTVSASAVGFETTQQNNVVVHVTDRLNIPFKLTPGKITETVTVISAAPLMQTQTAETGIDVDSKFLNDAPLANRNWIFIAQEAPGVTPMVGRGGGNGDFSSNGQHEEQNNYMLDGVDNNTMNSDYINGSSYNLAPPPDAIAEFKLETSNYSAEIGRGHAAVFNATTKSGTNLWHGDVWEYVRNTKFDALVWTQAPGSSPAKFNLNQFGATLGGPIYKNHLFYFGDIQEARYVNGANPSTLTVPTPRMRRGDFSELLNPTWTGGSCPTVLYVPNTNTGTYNCTSNNSNGKATVPTGKLQQFGTSQYTYNGLTFAPGQNVFAPSQLDPVAQKILQQYPCPNFASNGQPNFGKPNGGWTAGDCNAATDTDSGPTGGNYQVNLKNTSDPINWDQRLDWNISSHDLATFRVSYQHAINTFPAPLGPILDGIGSNQGHNQSYLSENFMLSETHTFSPTVINELRFGYNYGNDSNLQYNYNTDISASLGLGGVPFNAGPQNGGLPATADGFTGFGAHGNDPAHEGMNIYQILDNVTKVIGNHSLKMGFEAMPGRWYSTNASNPRGSYSYSGQFTQVTGLGGPSGNAGADFIALGTLPGGGYTNTNNMASAAISTFVYTHFVQQYMAGYVQDDWRMTQKLTLNLGLRYEYFTPKREQAGQLANFVMQNTSMTPNGGTGTAQLVLPKSQQNVPLAPNFLALLQADNVQVVYTSNPYLSSFPKENWSPRIGAAYQFTPKTVGRIGGGIFMGGFEPGGGAANVLNPPFIVNASSAALPSCSQGNYCESQYAFGNTLEGGLGQFMGTGGITNHASFPGVGEEDPVMKMPYTVQYNLSVEQALTPTTTMTLSFVGNAGRHLVTGINNPNMPQAITIGGQQSNGLTPAPHLSGQFWMSWTGASSYNALQAVVQKRYSHGLSFLATYTWGHAFDNTTDLLGGDIGSYKQAALIPIRYEWGQSGYDIRNRLVINTDYDLPFGVGRQFINRPGILDKIVGGWKTDMEFSGQTGQPFTVTISRISGWGNANGGLANSAVKIANPYATGLPAPNVNGNPNVQSGITSGASSNTAANVCAAQTRTRARWFNPCAFADPLGVLNSNNAAAVAQLAPYATGSFSYQSAAIGADTPLSNGVYSSLGQAAPYITGYANVAPFFGSPKNDVSGPGNWRLNASLFKDFKTWREQYLEFRADAFNVLNHPSFGNPGNTSTNIGANSVSLTGTGSNQSNTIDARMFQLSGKYIF